MGHDKDLLGFSVSVRLSSEERLRLPGTTHRRRLRELRRNMVGREVSLVMSSYITESLSRSSSQNLILVTLKFGGVRC